MAALDRLEELEEFVLALRPDESFRAHRLWQLPLTGLHDYALPETIAERFAPVEELARDVASAPVELVVCVTDVSDGETDEGDAFERVYSSRTATSEVMASAVLASAAISALVLPLRVGDVIGTDGSPGSPPHDRARRPGDLALDPTFRAGLEWPLGRSGARRARAGADGGGVARTGQEQGVRLKSDTCEVREVSES